MPPHTQTRTLLRYTLAILLTGCIAQAAPPVGKTISLNGRGNSKNVSANQSVDSLNRPLTATANSVSNSERFQVIDAGGGKIALKSVANGRYIASDRVLDAAQWPLAANRTKIGSWERFSWIENSDGTVSLRGDGNGRLVASDRNLNSTTWPLAANRNAIGAWEKFNVTVQGNNSGGGNGSGATPPPPSSGGNGLDGNKRPSENFDLKDWKITLPTGKEISENDLSNRYQDSQFFYTDSATGGVVFKSPNNGQNLSTTPNSKYLRCELREMLRAGNKKYKTKGIGKNNWVLSSSSSSNQNKAGGVGGRLECTLRVDRVSNTGSSSQVGRVIIGQVHASKDEPCRLYYRKLPGNSKGSIYFAHEPTKGSERWYEIIGSRSSNANNPSDGIALGETFSYTIDVTETDLRVTINRPNKGSKSKRVDMKNSGFADDYLYFKAGVYNQNNGGSGNDFAQATFFKIKNSH